MTVSAIILWSEILSGTLGLMTAALVLRARNFSLYWPLLPLSLWNLPVNLLLHWLRQYRPSSPATASHLYFCTYYVAFAFAAIASIVITYKLLGDALGPFKGIRSLAIIVYRWVAAVTVIAAFGILLPPGFQVVRGTATVLFQMIRVSSVLNLSLVAFLTFVIRPLGISRASRIFGVGIGLAIASLGNLLESSFSPSGGVPLSSMNLIGPAGQCIAQLVWVYYFARPEPPRRFVLLAVSSPLHAWNQIAAVLGNKPSYAAIGGVPPEAFSPAELGMITSVSEPSLAAAGSSMAARDYFVNMDALNAASSIKIPEPGPDRIAKMRREHNEEG